MSAERELLRQALRRDLGSFIHRVFQTVAPGDRYCHNWHIDVIAWHLEACFEGGITRLIITLPPRNLKSICVSVAFPAWILGHDPSRAIICASYSAELAAKHSRDCRAAIESAWYREVFRRTRLDPRKNTEAEFQTTAGGFRLATSVGGVLTGRGGDLIIVDDPLKASDAYSEAARERANEWFGNTLVSRLNDKRRGVIVVVTQRLHVDDLVGHLLATGGPWVHVNLPAIAEVPETFALDDGRVFTRGVGEALHAEREPKETLDAIKNSMGSYAFAAQYQQDPLPLEGGLIKWTWFRTYEVAPEPQEGDFISQSWDTASKAGELNDWSVCTTWLRRGGTHYLLDVLRIRAEYPHLKRLVVEMRQRHKADAVLIEDQGSGIQLIQDLHEEGLVHPIAITPHGDKAMRMFATTARIETGAVIIPTDAPWLDEFKGELLQFPHGRFNDQVDSLSQYLNWEGNYPVDLDGARFHLSEVQAEWGAADLVNELSAPWSLGP